MYKRDRLAPCAAEERQRGRRIRGKVMLEKKKKVLVATADVVNRVTNPFLGAVLSCTQRR